MREQLRNLLIALLGLSLSILTSVLVCIYGWGLQPKNWFWIIGVYLVGHMLARGIVNLSGKDKSK